MLPSALKALIFPSTGPWGSRGGNTGGNGGGWTPPPRPQPGGSQGPDLEALFKNARQKFGGGGPWGNARMLGLLGAALAALWLGSGFYRIEPSQHAVVLTFGDWTDTKTQPGLGWRAPWPIQDIQKVDVSVTRRLALGQQASGGEGDGESLMLTGDENIIDIDFVVLWRVADAGKYLFKIRDPETTLRKVAESAMREIIGRTEIQKALTEGRGDIETRTKELMQKILDEYQAGMIVSSVQLQKVAPPEPVVDAFDDVQRARSDKERARNEAETYANDVVPKARGEAQKKIQDAEAYKKSVLSKAQGEAQRFLSVLAAYREAKDVTQKRLYLETMEEILKNTRKVIASPGAAAPAVPVFPLDAVKTSR